MAAPSVSAPAARDAGEISRSYARSASPRILIALGFSSETTRKYAIESALASVTAPPSESGEISVTDEAALEAGALYMAQRSGRSPADGEQEEYASTGPVRPELGDGPVVEAPEDWITSPDSPPPTVPDEAPPVEQKTPAGDEPVVVHGGAEFAHTGSPEASDDVTGLTEEVGGETSYEDSGPDSAKLDGEPVQLVSSTEEDDGDTSSMTGPISTTEQVPTTLAGEEVGSGSEDGASEDGASEDGVSEDDVSEDEGSSEQPTSGGDSSEEPREEPPAPEPSSGGGEELAVAPAHKPERAAPPGSSPKDPGEASEKQAVSYPLPAPRSGTPAEQEAGGPDGRGQSNLAPTAEDAPTGQGGGEPGDGGPPQTVPVARHGLAGEDEGGQLFAIVPAPSGEDTSSESPESAEDSDPSAPVESHGTQQDTRIGSGPRKEQVGSETNQGPDGEQATTPAPPARQDPSVSSGSGEVPPSRTDEGAPSEEGAPEQDAGERDTREYSAEVRLVVASAEQSGAGVKAPEEPTEGASDGEPSDDEPAAQGRPAADGAAPDGAAPLPTWEHKEARAPLLLPASVEEGAPEQSPDPQETREDSTGDSTSKEYNIPTATQPDEASPSCDSSSEPAPDDPLPVQDTLARPSEPSPGQQLPEEQTRRTAPEDDAGGAPWRPDAPAPPDPSPPSVEASEPAPAAVRNPSTSESVPQPEIRPAPTASPEAGDTRAPIAQARGGARRGALHQEQQAADRRVAAQQDAQPAGTYSTGSRQAAPATGNGSAGGMAAERSSTRIQQPYGYDRSQGEPPSPRLTAPRRAAPESSASQSYGNAQEEPITARAAKPPTTAPRSQRQPRGVPAAPLPSVEPDPLAVASPRPASSTTPQSSSAEARPQSVSEEARSQAAPVPHTRAGAPSAGASGSATPTTDATERPASGTERE